MIETFNIPHLGTIVPLRKCLLFLRNLVKRQLWIPLQIINTVGDVLIEQTVNLPYSDNTISVSTALLTKGFYLTKVSKGNQFITQKLVVQ